MLTPLNLPVISTIVFTPILAGIIILFIDGRKRDLIRGVAISAAAVALALSALVYFNYNARIDDLKDSLASLAILEQESKYWWDIRAAGNQYSSPLRSIP